FGIGGGAVIVPALMLFAKFDQKLATGTSLGALLPPVGLPGAVQYYNAGQLNLETAIPLAVMLLLAAFFGARLALGLPTKTVKRMYGIFLLLVGLRFIINF
ncbi:MAG: sulfite exporter TauE/SafE family protein, partial [Aggregatilineales bacterium]